MSTTIAIVISNVETKILETIFMGKFNEGDVCDMYQFGFKKGHSTGLCTNIVKRTVDYGNMVATYLLVLWILVKHSIGLITGSFSAR